MDSIAISGAAVWRHVTQSLATIDSIMRRSTATAASPSPHSDLATMLVALDRRSAHVVPASTGPCKAHPLARLYTGPGETLLAPRISDPRCHTAAGSQGADVLSEAQPVDGGLAIASAMAIARVDGGLWHDVRLCLGGIAPTPWRAFPDRERARGARCCAARLRQAIDRELDACAHPARQRLTGRRGRSRQARRTPSTPPPSGEPRRSRAASRSVEAPEKQITMASHCPILGWRAAAASAIRTRPRDKGSIV